MNHAVPRFQDFFSGALFFCVGAVTIAGASQHPFGTAMRMGAGTFPLFLGALLMIFGLTVLARTVLEHRRQGHRISDFSPVGLGRVFRRLVSRHIFKEIVLPAALIGCGVLAFAKLLPATGLASAIVVLVIISGAAHHEARWRELFPLGAALAAFGVGVFIWGLGLPLLALPT